MTYTAEASKSARQPLNIIRIDLDTKISGTYEYVCDGMSPPSDPPIYPCAKKIEWIPNRIDPEGGIGYLGEVVITCLDFTWPSGSGTYFGRLLANNPYVLNRTLKIYSGFLRAGESFSLSNFQERDYFIRDITGPDAQGNVKIYATDILSQTKESTMPRRAITTLDNSLTDSATGYVYIGDETDFPLNGNILINDEIIGYIDATDGTDVIDVNARGKVGTDAQAHAASDEVRYVEYYSGNCVDVILDIIQDHTDIDDTTYITAADWDTERDTYLAGDNVDVWVIEPTTVDKVLDDICKQCYINLFWDDLNQKIRLKAIGPNLSPSVEWTDSANILNTKVSIKRPQKNIYTQYWAYFGKINQTEGNQAKNFSETYILVNTDIETGLGTDNIKRIYCGYIPANGSATASKIASRFLNQRKNPIDVTFEVDTKDHESVEPGDLLDLNTDLIQGTDGLPLITTMRVIEKSQRPNNRWKYRAVFSGIDPGTRYGLIAPNTVNNYTSESTSNQATYGFIADTDDELSNDDPAYIIL